jgi:hypothetical protein
MWDRRVKLRFPFKFRAWYRTGDYEALLRPCETVNLSSGGVLLKGVTEVLPGAIVRAVIEWPISRHEGHPVNLHLEGVVVRCLGFSVAVSFKTYEFRMSRPQRLPMNSDRGQKEAAS